MTDTPVHTQSMLDTSPPKLWTKLLFVAVIAGGLAYCANQLAGEVANAQEATPWLLLLLALLIALGFEFVNGFHDTANAVATVIYTRSLTPHVAVVWSGLWNFFGVMMASGAVAWGIVSLLPVELILQVNSSAGLAMVFALLLAAVIWNLGMLILVGVVPTAFALNRTPDPALLDQFRGASAALVQTLDRYAQPGVIVADPAAAVADAVRTKTWTPQTTVALSQFIVALDQRMVDYKSLANVPTDLVSNLRNDLYLVSEALKLVDK